MHYFHQIPEDGVGVASTVLSSTKQSIDIHGFKAIYALVPTNPRIWRRCRLHSILLRMKLLPKSLTRLIRKGSRFLKTNK
jgi:hypothetical protein